MVNHKLKFTETTISTQNTIYLKEELRNILKAGPNDVLEWYIENGEVKIRKKEEKE